ASELAIHCPTEFSAHFANKIDGDVTQFSDRHEWLLTTAHARAVLGVFLEGSHDRLFTAEAALLHALDGMQHAPVIFVHDFDEFWRHLVPEGEHFPGALALG